MFTQLNSLGSIMEEAKTKMKNETKTALEAGFKEMFSNYPEIEFVRWNQYTPYFMDGDPCVFGVNQAILKLNPEFLASITPGAEPREDDDYCWEGDEYALAKYDWQSKTYTYPSKRAEEIKQVLTELNKSLRSLKEGLQLSLGDHVQVTVTPEGITIESFEHD